MAPLSHVSFDLPGDERGAIANVAARVRPGLWEGWEIMSGLKRVSTMEARSLLDEGYTYIDVRSEPEYAAGHASGAVNVPIMNMTAAGMSNNPAFVAVMLGAFAKDAKLLVGCKAGSRSLRAAELLREAGFVDIVDHRAGFDGARGPFGQAGEAGWAAAGMPVEQGATPGRSYPDIKAKAGL